MDKETEINKLIIELKAKTERNDKRLEQKLEALQEYYKTLTREIEDIQLEGRLRQLEVETEERRLWFMYRSWQEQEIKIKELGIKIKELVKLPHAEKQDARHKRVLAALSGEGKLLVNVKRLTNILYACGPILSLLLFGSNLIRLLGTIANEAQTYTMLHVVLPYVALFAVGVLTLTLLLFLTYWILKPLKRGLTYLSNKAPPFVIWALMIGVFVSEIIIYMAFLR